MKKEKGIKFEGSLRLDGITFYQRGGKTIMRSSSRSKSRGFTMKQFVQRQRMRHTVALWRQLEYCYPMFTKHQSAYNGFMSLANHLPAVFVDKYEAMNSPSFLMPGIPVSDGTLPEVMQHLGEVEGRAALITDLPPYKSRKGVELRLFVAEQTMSPVHKVEFNVRSVSWGELVKTATGTALVGEEFADDNKGWALVMVKGEECSPQGIVTRCTYYEQFTTKEVRKAAARSYGGLKEPPFLSPASLDD